MSKRRLDLTGRVVGISGANRRIVLGHAAAIAGEDVKVSRRLVVH